MKKFKLYLCIGLFMFCAALLAQESKEQYQKALAKTLVQVDSAKSTKDLLLAQNQLERISQVYKNEWLPIYYTAYVDLQSVFYEPKNENNEKILTRAKAELDKLDSFSSADQSEVNTLWGYYYMAMIILDPQVNGAKYFSDVNLSFEKAMKQNAENPRAKFLSAYFEQNLPDFLRSKRNFCDEMKQAKALYAKQPKTLEKPYWGESFLNMISANCN